VSVALHIERRVGISLASSLVGGDGILVKGCWHPLVQSPLGVGILCIDTEYVKDSVNGLLSLSKESRESGNRWHPLYRSGRPLAHIYIFECIKLSGRSVRPVVNTLHVAVYFEVHQTL
jgi:hypothetical protein